MKKLEFKGRTIYGDVTGRDYEEIEFTTTSGEKLYFHDTWLEGMVDVDDCQTCTVGSGSNDQQIVRVEDNGKTYIGRINRSVVYSSSLHMVLLNGREVSFPYLSESDTVPVTLNDDGTYE